MNDSIPRPTENELRIIKSICNKYNVSSVELSELVAVLMLVGYRPIHKTAQLLRAVADSIESDIGNDIKVE